MTLTEQIITIGMVVLGTMITRFLPFLLFPAGKPVPKYVQYLGKALPSAVFGLLVIYCLKGPLTVLDTETIAAAIAIAGIVILHLWKRNTLLSVAAGTVLYMIFIRCLP